MVKSRSTGGGFTLVELIVSIVVLGIVSSSLLLLYTGLINSTSISKRKAIALTLATNQMEYLKSLPYSSLAVAGGSIYSTSPLPATKTATVNGDKSRTSSFALTLNLFSLCPPTSGLDST